MSFINQKHLLIVLILNLKSIQFCVCPDNATISKYRITHGNWEPASNDDVVDKDLAVVGAVDPIDGEIQYICRARNGRNLLPGKLALKKCYIARFGGEDWYRSYEVLVNRDGSYLEWVKASNGYPVDGAVLGGLASDGWPMFVCRARHKGRKGKWRLVSGKLNPRPGFECCYIPYAGKEHCYKSYQVLRKKL